MRHNEYIELVSGIAGSAPNGSLFRVGDELYFKDTSGSSVELVSGDTDSILFNPQSATPNADEGRLYYDNSFNSFFYYNGATWQEVGATVESVPSLLYTPQSATPNADEGRLYYDDLLNKFFYYNGSAWVEVGEGSFAWNIPIDSSVTVDTGSTYDMGTSGATLNNVYTDDIVLSEHITHNGDPNTRISFLSDKVQLEAGGVVGIDCNASGILFSETGARITTVLDEDAMGSDSATALATQQSIKKYVDDTVDAKNDFDSVLYNPQSATPNADEGRLYYDDLLNSYYYYNGSAWVEVGQGTFGWNTPIDSSVTVDTPDTHSLGATGAQLAELYSTDLFVDDSIIHNGDTNTSIDFGADSIVFKTGGTNRLDLANTGLRIGTGGAIVTTIYDQDDMLADSATALSTQQSIKKYVDDSVGGGGSDNDLDSTPDTDETANGFTSTKTAGESLVFGDLCYMKSDGKLWKTDANTAATMPGLYLSLAIISADATGSFLLQGFARDDSWSWTIGGPLYASATAGAITQSAPSTSGDQVQLLGIAQSATVIDFRPQPSFDEVA